VSTPGRVFPPYTQPRPTVKFAADNSLPAAVTMAYAAANLRVGASTSQSTITALTMFQIRPLRNAAW
jgi:hypothetical protein